MKLSWYDWYDGLYYTYDWWDDAYYIEDEGGWEVGVMWFDGWSWITEWYP